MSEESKTESRPIDKPQDDRPVEGRRVPPSEEERPGSKIWIFLSFAISAVILGWGFTLPFRHHERPLLMWDESDVPRSEADGVRKVRMTAEEIAEYRADAIARDQDFLRQRREQLRQRRPLPDGRDAEEKRAKHLKSIRATINSLKDARKGSLEAKYREELEASLDAPSNAYTYIPMSATIT